MNNSLHASCAWNKLRCGKWLMVMLLIALVAVYVVSIRSEHTYSFANGPISQVQFDRGCCTIRHENRQNRKLFFGFSLDVPFDHSPVAPIFWRFEFSRFGNDWFLVVPLWAVVLPTGLFTGILSYRDRASVRRRRVGACVRCGYDLRGLLANARCPECGWKER